MVYTRRSNITDCHITTVYTFGKTRLSLSSPVFWVNQYTPRLKKRPTFGLL